MRSHNSKTAAAGQATDRYDAETGEIYDAPGTVGADDASGMFEQGEGKSADGVIGLPKITTEAIRALPERCKQLNAPMKICSMTGMARGVREMPNADRSQIFYGLHGLFGAVVFDNNGEAEKAFTSDTLFFPINHQQALDAFEKAGFLEFSLEFWSQPAGNPRGYSWYYRNLAQIDRNNLSPIHKLLRLTVEAGRRMDQSPSAGLIADLRKHG